jgi:hypothetical protein
VQEHRTVKPEPDEWGIKWPPVGILTWPRSQASEFRGPAFTGVLKKPAATPGEPRLPGDSPLRPPLSLDH